jgi:diacylglycerol kinase (ATP)
VLLAIGNTAYFGGGMKVCPGARPDDGRCQIAIIGPVSRRTFLRVFPKVFKGGHVTDRRVTMLEGTEVSIDDVAVDIWADGDPLGPAPMRFEARRGALQIAGAQW